VIVGKKTVWEQLPSCSFLVACLDPTNLFLSRLEHAENVNIYLQCMLARLICLVNIMTINVLREKKIEENLMPKFDSPDARVHGCPVSTTRVDGPS